MLMVAGCPNEELRMVEMTAAVNQVPLAQDAEEPRILDTYSLVYAFTLLFLVPAMPVLSTLPFGASRGTTYTPAYVSLVTVPFVLGIALTFLLDSRDGLRKSLLRIVILMPLIVLTGVTIMFGLSFLMLPASMLLGIRDQGLNIVWWAALAVVAAPLIPAFLRRLKRGSGVNGAFQAFALASALALLAGLVFVSFFTDLHISELGRKDTVIYVVGALSWYLPSFGIAAGFWRRTGLV
jgi:MFS family permease